MTSTIFDSKLLVDIESGRVLRADDRVFVSARNIDAHPFMTWLGGKVGTDERPDTVFAGPDAARRKLARSRGEGEEFLDAVEYEVHSVVAGIVELQKVEAV